MNEAIFPRGQGNRRLGRDAGELAPRPRPPEKGKTPEDTLSPLNTHIERVAKNLEAYGPLVAEITGRRFSNTLLTEVSDLKKKIQLELQVLSAQESDLGRKVTRAQGERGEIMASLAVEIKDRIERLRDAYTDLDTKLQTKIDKIHEKMSRKPAPEKTANKETVPPPPENPYITALETAHEQVALGVPIDEVVTAMVTRLDVPPEEQAVLKQSVSGMRQSIDQLAALMRSGSMDPKTREALFAALTSTGSGAEVPDTPEAREAATILADINSKMKDIKPPKSLGRYHWSMAARPVAEGAGIVAEGGLATLIVSSLLTATFGVEIPARSMGHGAVYALSALGWNLKINLAGTKTAALQEVAETGSIGQGLAQWLGIHKDKDGNWHFRPVQAAKSTVRVISLGALLSSGTAVVQKTLAEVERSQQTTSLIETPVHEQKERVAELDTRLHSFAKVIPAILDIAKRIEAGHPPSASTPAAAPSAKGAKQSPKALGWRPYAPEEIDQIKQRELVPLFSAAGLDPHLLSELKFAQPTSLGEGPAYKFKRALETGNLGDLHDLAPADQARLATKFGHSASSAEMVEKIRTKMGLRHGQSFDARIGEIVNDFLKHEKLAAINSNLEEIERISNIIRTQGESELKVFLAAFLEGSPTVGVEAALPWVEKVIEQNDAIKKLTHDSISAPISEMLRVLSDALAQVGGSVSVMEIPEFGLDVTPLQHLAASIEKITTDAAQAAVAERAAKSTLGGITNILKPGGEKAEGAERYLRNMHLKWAGYMVRYEAGEARLYERTDAGSNHLPEATARSWSSYLFGTSGTQEIERLFPHDLQVGQIEGPKVQTYLKDIASLVARRAGEHPHDQTLQRIAQEYTAVEKWDASDIETMARNQIGAQFKSPSGVPILYPPSVWQHINDGESAPQETIDKQTWADTVARFGGDFNANDEITSLLSDEAVGNAVLRHVETALKKMEVEEPDSYMTKQYRAMIGEGRSKREELGRSARVQLAQQIEQGNKPIVVYPQGVWNSIIDPSLASGSVAPVDTTLWRQLPEEKARTIFASYEKVTSIEAYGGIAALVGLLSLGTFLASLFAVQRKNENLLQGAEEFTDKWKKTEQEMLLAIDSFNALLATLPFFSSLPRLTPYELRAALRALAEEYTPELREDLTRMQALKKEAKNVASKGQYAEPIQEIFAMEKTMKKMQSSPAAQRRLADIIVPGLYEVAQKAASLSAVDNSLPPAEAMRQVTTALGEDTRPRELFLNAARGHLRFRHDVAQARRVFNERSQKTLVASPAMPQLLAACKEPVSLSKLAGDGFMDTDSLDLLGKLVINNTENQQFDHLEMHYATLLDKLDKQSQVMKAVEGYNKPLHLTRRKDIEERATKSVDISTNTPSKEFSLSAALASDENLNIPDIGRKMQAACAKIYESTKAARDAHLKEHPDHVVDIRLNVDNDGEVALNIVITEKSAIVQTIPCPIALLQKSLEA